ncbi:MAG: hypothetical protein MMC33_005945 [Icmadophila ericetorum]|nr:hypothetical protein [Icmadophila ericetorum]
MSKAKILEGVFAIDKPKGIGSAQVVRDLQKAFGPTKLFAPWLAAEKASRDRVNANQRKRRRDKSLNVKIGHGGTLDPLATGVLVIGVGKGTKQLQQFLACTKSYEAVLLFGVATDSYDVQGKVLSRAPFTHVTREGVEKALDGFRGQIMQRPPIFSARRIQGKRLYEYAREGMELPQEIRESEVNVESLEVVDWLEPGTHEYAWPKEEAEKEDKETAHSLLKIDITSDELAQTKDGSPSVELKRKRNSEPEEEDLVHDAEPVSKQQKTKATSEALMSGGLQSSEIKEDPSAVSDADAAKHGQQNPISSTFSASPPAVRLRMTVTSGFYVRSLCHELGKALGSLGIMAELVRTRQGDFELRKNTLAYEVLEKGEEVFGPDVKAFLETWQKRATYTSGDETS